jgi:hypothetical protein
LTRNASSAARKSARIGKACVVGAADDDRVAGGNATLALKHGLQHSPATSCEPRQCQT